MTERLPPLLEAVYGAFAIDFPLVAGTERRDSLAFESHYLATTLAELLPDEPEVLGLAALISLSLARQRARGTADTFVRLDEQQDWRVSTQSPTRRCSAFSRRGQHVRTCWKRQATLKTRCSHSLARYRSLPIRRLAATSSDGEHSYRSG